MSSIQPPLPTGVSPEAFAENWGRYLFVLETVGRRRLQEHGDEEFKQSFTDLYDDVFREIRSKESISALQTAVAAALEEAGNEVPIGFLMQEMDAYQHWQETSSSAAPHAVEVGKTIKDSCESVLGKFLTNRVRKVLGVVNELLSIVRGGA